MDDGIKYLYETPLVGRKPVKRREFSNCDRSLTICNLFDFLLVGFYALS